MKHMTLSIAVVAALSATSPLFAAETPRGVAGVDVIVKQNPSKRAVTDGRGNFALGALPAGPCTLTFRARKAQDTKNSASDKVAVATTYSIKVEGAKRPVNQSGLISNHLIAGYDVRVEVGAGANVRGQVAAGAIKKMVWISKEPGSNIPGHWAEEGSVEAKRAFKSNAHGMSGDGLRRWMDNASDVHQEGFPTLPVGSGH